MKIHCFIQQISSFFRTVPEKIASATWHQTMVRLPQQGALAVLGCATISDPTVLFWCCVFMVQTCWDIRRFLTNHEDFHSMWPRMSKFGSISCIFLLGWSNFFFFPSFRLSFCLSHHSSGDCISSHNLCQLPQLPINLCTVLQRNLTRDSSWCWWSRTPWHRHYGEKNISQNIFGNIFQIGKTCTARTPFGLALWVAALCRNLQPTSQAS